MYARRETLGAHDRFWRSLRDELRSRGINAPNNLSYPTDLPKHWQDPELLLSQTCGLPFKTYLRERVQLVGTAELRLPACPDGFYYSVFVVDGDEQRIGLEQFDNASFAYNSKDSQSGWAAAIREAQNRGIKLKPALATGSHSASCRAVDQGLADIAAIDVQSWWLIRRFDQWAARLRVVDATPPTPALPFITAYPAFVSPLRDAMQKIIAGMGQSERSALGLHGLLDLSENAYYSVVAPQGDV